MRITSIVVVGGIFLSSTAAFGAPSTSTSITLRCIGYRQTLNDTIGHDVIIDGARATVDGQSYTVSTQPTDYWLTSVDLANRITLVIDRVDGSYHFMQGDPDNGQSYDWSRPQDPGCKAVKTLF